MALPVMYFQPQAQSPAQSFMQGAQAAYQIPDLQTQLQSEQLKNAMMGVQNQYLPQQLQSQIALNQAQAARQNAMSQLPFGGMSLPGVAGQILGLEAIRRMYGDNSPQYTQAKNAFALQQNATQSKIGYQNALTTSMPVRYATPTGKSAIEEANVQQGFSPTGTTWPQAVGINARNAMPANTMSAPGANTIATNSNTQLPTAPTGSAPSFASQLSDQYELLRQKNTTDANARQRNLFATNIEKTIQNINPDDLTQYAGAAGSLERLDQGALAQIGKQSDAYDRYQKSLIAAQMLATQVRQFYGDSVQPGVQEKLKNLTNPDTWNTNPQLAKQNFLQLKNILNQEIQTYRDSLQGRGVYLGNSPTASTSTGSNNSAANITKVLNGKTYTKINGKWYQQ